MVKTPEAAPSTIGKKGAQDDAQAAEAEAVAAAEVAAAATTATPDYDDALDSIVGWSINRKDSTVTLTTRRLTDDTQREVPEEWIQRVNEKKVVDYWASFNKPREVTVKCATYRVFRILDHKPGKVPKLAIHWIGYTANFQDGSASWEPLDVILRSSEALVLEYLHVHGLTKQLTPKKRGLSAAVAAAAAAGNTTSTSTTTTPDGRGRRARTSSPGNAAGKAVVAAAAPTTITTLVTASKKRRSNSEAPLAKRARKSAGAANGNQLLLLGTEGGAGSDANRLALVKVPSKRGRSSVASKAPGIAAAAGAPGAAATTTTTKTSPPSSPSSSHRAIVATSSRQPKTAAQNNSALYRLDLNISGVPHKDIQQLLKLATELTAQGRSVSLSSKVTPL
ncbi:hypothetical protein MAPG_11924 [Magnaporthiopsis poae ATCC 64411]|uniref:Chromo domain-containing protein n=1 Tax=Magnaporthiopsis poae (strain ATCC 64411 / 73-15) TaxID=644358 RepID=A0A0C4EGH8_MAGP6|nr:hypothetical protein MAPG_11924 [Magnaporthiopsis poae ATCC 64411]